MAENKTVQSSTILPAFLICTHTPLNHRGACATNENASIDKKHSSRYSLGERCLPSTREQRRQKQLIEPIETNESCFEFCLAKMRILDKRFDKKAYRMIESRLEFYVFV